MTVKNYKLKTHKGTAKRIQKTGSGKFVHFKMGRNHLRRRKSGRILQSLDKKRALSEGDSKKMSRLMPYGN
jgi:large subunit ribosomal protein L35